MKRLLPFSLAILAVPLAAQPGLPPADGPFSCLFEDVSAEQRILAGSAASQRLTDAPADGEQRGGTALDAILAGLPRCAEAGRWSEPQRNLAREYLVAQLAREDMRRRYVAQNVDLTFLDEAVAGGRGGTLPFDELVARVRAQGVTGDRPDSAEDIVFIYVGLAGQAEAIRAGFAHPAFQRR